MTPAQRDDRIIDILTKIVIGTLTNNLFEINEEKQLKEISDILNELPVNEEEYSRCNASHSFLQKQAADYL